MAKGNLTPVPKPREWTLMSPRRQFVRPPRNTSNSPSTQLSASAQQQSADSSQSANTVLQTAIMLQFFM